MPECWEALPRGESLMSWFLVDDSILFWKTVGIFSSQKPVFANREGLRRRDLSWVNGSQRVGIEQASMLALKLFVCAGRGPEQACSPAVPSPHRSGGLLPEDPAGSAAGGTAGCGRSKGLSFFARRKEEDCSRATCSPFRSSQTK